MPDKQKINQMISPDYIFGLILKYRWYIILPICVSLIAGIYLFFTMPRMYEAITLILVQPQKVSQNYVRSLTSMDINSRIGTITQQIRSRTNLEKIIQEFDLFSGPKYEKMFAIEKIISLNKQIDIAVRSARGQDSFSITYQGIEPERVMKITNKLATIFINENLKMREEQSVGTSVFLDAELNDLRKKLEKTEQIILQYRQQHMGEMPDHLATNLRLLSQKKKELSEKQTAIRELKSLLSQTEMQMSTMAYTQDSIFQNNDYPDSSDSSFDIGIGESMQVAELKEQLKTLTLKYTDRHPDVVRLRESIKQLETQENIESQEKAEETLTESTEEETTPFQFDSQSILSAQRDELKNELKQLKIEIVDLQRQVRLYENRIANTEKREQELLTINRDYANVKSSYDSMLNRKLESDIAVNMEKKQKGEQFRILDYAKLPDMPISPNGKKLLLISLVAGFGIAAGLIYVLEFLGKSIKRKEDLKYDLGIAVMATIPRIYSPKDKLLGKLNFVLSICSIVFVIFLLSGFVMLVLNGLEPTIDYVQKFAKI